MTGSDDNAPDLLREALDTAEGVLSNLESSLDHSTVDWAEVVTALKRVRQARAVLATPSSEPSVEPDLLPILVARERVAALPDPTAGRDMIAEPMVSRQAVLDLLAIVAEDERRILAAHHPPENDSDLREKAQQVLAGHKPRSTAESI